MKIATINVNGIREAVGRGFLDWLANQDADVVCVQNLKAKSFELDDSILFPEGYEATSSTPSRTVSPALAFTAARFPRPSCTGWAFPSATMKRASCRPTTTVSASLPS